VSNVLSGAAAVSDPLRKRVLKAIAELDYHPDQVARSLKIRKTRLLGTVISDITNPFFPLLVRGAEDAAWKRGNLLITFNTDDRVEREVEVLRALRGRQVDGVLLVAASSRGPQPQIRALLDAGIPVVLVDRAIDSLETDTLTVDNRGGSRDVVRHLIQQGHSRIGILAGDRDLVISHERRAGYRDALQEAGIRPDPNLEAFGVFRADSGYEQASLLLDQASPPTAIFAANGMLALGLLSALEDRGIPCPGDISIACFDEMPIGPVRPRITCAAQPAYQLGCVGIDMLLDRIAHPARPVVRRQLPTRLVLGDSVAPPRRRSGA
jgi:LacI family transcriptional regulator